MLDLKDLENRTIYIVREAYAEFKRPGVLWSVGKDSTTMLWLCRKAFFGKVPFPVIHIDTGYKFRQMYEFRDRIAREWGLGDFDAAKIQVDGEMPVLDDFKLPPLGGEAIAGNPEVLEILEAKTLLRPVADPELCTACGACVDHCPVAALEIEDTFPVVEADTCITCFCCQEICPEKAIALQ